MFSILLNSHHSPLISFWDCLVFYINNVTIMYNIVFLLDHFFITWIPFSPSKPNQGCPAAVEAVDDNIYWTLQQKLQEKIKTFLYHPTYFAFMIPHCNLFWLFYLPCSQITFWMSSFYLYFIFPHLNEGTPLWCVWLWW